MKSIAKRLGLFGICLLAGCVAALAMLYAAIIIIGLTKYFPLETAIGGLALVFGIMFYEVAKRKMKERGGL